MQDEDDKKFLQQIKDTGKSGTLGAVNMKSHKKDVRAAKRHAAEVKRQNKEKERLQAAAPVIQNDESSDTEIWVEPELPDDDYIPPTPHVKRVSVLTAGLCQSWDRVGLSDRGAARGMVEMLKKRRI